MPTTTLTSNFMWSDGSLSISPNYLQLQYIYITMVVYQGWFFQLLQVLLKNSYPGKVMVNDQETGLYLPYINNYSIYIDV